MTFPVRVEIAEGLLANMERLRAENAELRRVNGELRMLLGWIEQSHTLTYAKKLIAEFRKPADFPLIPPGGAAIDSPPPGEAGETT